MPNSTPGQVAYEAHVAALGFAWDIPWERLLRRTQHAWEAAAQAVLTGYLESVARLCAQELAQPQEGPL